MRMPAACTLRVRAVMGIPGRPKMVSMPLSLRASMTSEKPSVSGDGALISPLAIFGASSAGLAAGEMTLASPVFALRVSPAVVVGALVAVTEGMSRSFVWILSGYNLSGSKPVSCRLPGMRLLQTLFLISPKWLRREALRVHRRLGHNVHARGFDLCSPHRSQHEPGHQRSDRVHDAGGDEDGVPIARHRSQQARQGNQKRSCALGGVEQA